jgi:hypothetical protein
LVAQGRLKGRAGKPNNAASARVSEKSLFQFLFGDHLNHCSDMVFRGLKTGLKKVEINSGQIAKANCFFPNGRAQREGRGERNGRSKTRCLHHDFAERHQFSFRWRAAQLAPRDAAMQDDLVQEMSLAALEYDKPADFDFLFELATNRAKNYLKYEASRGMLPLDAARYSRDPHAEETASLERLIENLMESGVPAAWIEEALKEKGKR